MAPRKRHIQEAGSDSENDASDVEVGLLPGEGGRDAEGPGEDLIGESMYHDVGDSEIEEENEEDAAFIDSDEDDDADAHRGDIDIGARRQLEAQLENQDREVRHTDWSLGREINPADMGDFEDGSRRRSSSGRVPGVGSPGELASSDPDLLFPPSEGGNSPSSPNGRPPQFDDDSSDSSDEDEDMANMTLDELAAVKAPSVAEWITMPRVSRSIAHEFQSFLTEFTIDGQSVYGTRIRTLAGEQSESLQVDFQHLVETRAVLAYFLTTAPTEMLHILDAVAVESISLIYPEFIRNIHPEIHVRISGLPASMTLRQLREQHLNMLVRVQGVVTRRTGVFPQLKWVKFDCQKCGQVLGPYAQDSFAEVKINFCYNCQSRGPFSLNSELTVYRNYQRITLQETPGTVPAGRLPRHRDVILLWDLIDNAKPGDEIDLTGIYRNSYDGGLNAKSGFPVFATVIEANFLRRRDAGLPENQRLTELEEREVRQLSREPNIIDKIVKSIAPSIFGHNFEKTALACSLFGGVPKTAGKVRLRGDINVLLLGDPGTAKSQFLKYSEMTSHRAVFATGQGASAVGLTASVRKDPMTREWTLEGGALVLADKGMCLIDEFDKMNDQDRTSIHEAMEQQSISISKAGIVTSLQARCAVVAAANPEGGRYNSTLPFAQNVDLTEPILSRFDVLCVVRDVVNEEQDTELASFVVDSHSRAHPKSTTNAPEDEVESEQLRRTKYRRKGPIPQELLRNYIFYARTKVRPQLLSLDEDRISALYQQLRKESLATGSFPITVRHLESIIRLSESFARMRLSDYVSKDDVDRAVKVTVKSFIGAQKISVRKNLMRTFARFLD